MRSNELSLLGSFHLDGLKKLSFEGFLLKDYVPSLLEVQDDCCAWKALEDEKPSSRSWPDEVSTKPLQRLRVLEKSQNT